MDFILLLVLLMGAFRLGQFYERKDEEPESFPAEATANVGPNEDRPGTQDLAEDAGGFTELKAYGIDQQTSERKIYFKMKFYTTSREDTAVVEDTLDTYKDCLSRSGGTFGIESRPMRLEAVSAKLARWKRALGRIQLHGRRG
ncbi:hypothetical protein G7Y79_00001g000780 [Physcia stellaris]|nr:hypothetical protein G7Y79_00001g000780 [Physcia stellaris]